MPTVLEAPLAAFETAPTRDYSHLKRYQFQPGNTISKTGGRPKGVLNSQTVLLKSAPKLAKAYVTEGVKGNATILVDARKWMLPTDEDAGRALAPQIIVFVGTSPSNNPLLVAADASASLTIPAPPAHA